jgi:hypothetical protein
MAINLDDLKPYVVTSDPSDKIFLFYGEMATRKTSVACRFPQSLLIAFDIGYKFIANGDYIPAPCQNWQDFKSIVKQLDKPTNKERFKTIIIDTVGMAYQACYQYVCTQLGVSDPGEAGGYGMGWKKVRNEFEVTLRSIAQKGYGLIMLAHSDEVEKEDKVTKKKVLGVKIDIDKRPDLIIKGLADFVFFLHKEMRDGTDIPTVYAYSKLVDIDTKSRSMYLTPRFEFTYENLLSELESAIERQYSELGQAIPTNVEQSNPYEVSAVDFEQLRADTIAIATILTNNGYDKDVGELLVNVFKGTPISKLEPSDEVIQKLQVVYSSLDELKSKARL